MYDRYGRKLAYLDRADGWDYSTEAALPKQRPGPSSVHVKIPKLNTRVRFPSSAPRIPAETLPPTASVTGAYLSDTCDWSVSRAKGANYIRCPQPGDNPVGVNQQFNVP
jgi:hypothetical protein